MRSNQNIERFETGKNKKLRKSSNKSIKLRRKYAVCLFVILISLYFVVGQTSDGRKLELVVQTGHSENIASLAFSPDGKLLASAGWDRTIKLWNAVTGRQIKSLTDNDSGGFFTIAFSPNGKMLASGNANNNITFWDIETGRVIKTLKGHTGYVQSIAFSSNGKFLASGSDDKTVKIWNLETGQVLNTLESHTDLVKSIAFSADNRFLISGSKDKTIKIWNATTGQLLKSIPGNGGMIELVVFSPDSRTVASVDNLTVIKLWDIETGQLVRSLGKGDKPNMSLAFSPDGKTLASGGWGLDINLWNVETGQLTKTLKGHSSFALALSFSPDSRTLASGSFDKTIKFWDVPTGIETKTLEAKVDPVISAVFSPDGKLIASGGFNKKVSIWDAEKGRKIKTLDGKFDLFWSIKFSPDGRMLALPDGNFAIGLWEVESGRKIRTLSRHTGTIYSMDFSPDGKILASAGKDTSVKLWNVETGQEIKALKGHLEAVTSIVFSPDGKKLVSGSWNFKPLSNAADKVIIVWNVETGQIINSAGGNSDAVYSMAISPDGRILATGGSKNIKLWSLVTGGQIAALEGDFPGTIQSIAFSPSGKFLASGNTGGKMALWNVENKRLLKASKEHTGEIRTIEFSPDGRFILSGSRDGMMKLWDLEKDNNTATLTSLGEDDWIVVDADGRFDASENAFNFMHYAYGLEIINLEQLKEMYYEPGLLQKIMGFSQEPLRPIVALEDIKLYPEILEQKFDRNAEKLTIKLKNRGGGIGETRVLVNGKLAVDDARDAKLRANPNVADGEIVTLNVDLRGASYLKGGENKITVVTSNYLKAIGKGNIQSRGSELLFVNNEKKEEYKLPSLYAVVGGVSDYDGDQIDLRFAAKDAETFSDALSLGAKRLFCPKEKPNCLDKVQITTLSTSGREGTIQPTKENFRKAFAEIAKRAKPEDIVVIYMAGHGVSFGAGTDTYFYLTKEARSASKEDLAKVFQTTAISSTELTDWLTLEEWQTGEKGIKALKQVLILDTCAAGTAASQLALTKKRDLSGDQIRAIEFLKDKTGTFVLMGSTADAPSYEASQYGQGLLTYSLLQAMKGAELDRGEFIDVRKLFSYAEKEVPKMAENIGGVQKPIVSAPLGKTFVIGQMTENEKKQINLPSSKPLMLRPLFINPETGDDDLKLIPQLRKRFDAESSYEVVRQRGGKEPILIYVDDDGFPGGIKITGTYTVAGGEVKIKAFLRRDNKTIAALPEITASKGEIVDKLFGVIQTELSRVN